TISRCLHIVRLRDALSRNRTPITRDAGVTTKNCDTAIEHELNLLTVFPMSELHGAVVEFGEAQRDQIESVILIQPPRLFRSLFWKDGARSLEIAGRQGEGRLFGDAWIAATRCAVGV